MSLLLDTHVLLWWLADEPLSDDARAAISDGRTAVRVSAASAWEIAIKKALGKLQAPDDLPEQLERHRFQPLPITVQHGLAVADLPLLHGDPFDRMLAAQARLESLTLVTRDERLAAYGVPTLAA